MTRREEILKLLDKLDMLNDWPPATDERKQILKRIKELF
jgi:hypothetical protein